MNVKLNDKTITIPANSSLEECLNINNISTKGIATALNGTVIPANERLKTILKDGDNIIIIKAFYGG